MANGSPPPITSPVSEIWLGGNPASTDLSTRLRRDATRRHAGFRIANRLEQGTVIERSGQIRPQQAEDRARGLVLFDGETCAILRRRRWQQPPRTHPAPALTLAALLQALFLLTLWHDLRPGLQPAATGHIDGDQVLIVRLIDQASLPRAARPPPESMPPRQAATARAHPLPPDRPRPDAMAVQDHAAAAPESAASAAATPAIDLFAKDGSVRLPPAETTYATTGAKAEPSKPADDRRIMQHDSNRMHYKATRFEKYFPPPNETAGGALGRHIGDALKEMTKGMCDPNKRSTASSLLCGAPPVPPSPKDGDERLSLPPPALAADPHPPAPTPLSDCIAEYNANKPLSYGCPVDTPDLAFKAELRVCIDLFRAGKRLKTWCPADTPERAAAEPATHAAFPGAGSH